LILGRFFSIFHADLGGKGRRRKLKSFPSPFGHAIIYLLVKINKINKINKMKTKNEN
jgi:hypothetical protein